MGEFFSAEATRNQRAADEGRSKAMQQYALQETPPTIGQMSAAIRKIDCLHGNEVKIAELYGARNYAQK